MGNSTLPCILDHEIGVEDGEIIASSKGLHLYDYTFDLAKIRTYRMEGTIRG